MKLLLDTHIWIWAILEPERLGGRAREALVDSQTDNWLSPVSIWELTLLIEKGRFQTDCSPAEWVAQARSQAAWHDAPLTEEVAIESSRLRLPNRDPADRFLLATARVYELTLVTADRQLLATPGFRILPGG